MAQLAETVAQVKPQPGQPPAGGLQLPEPDPALKGKFDKVAFELTEK